MNDKKMYYAYDMLTSKFGNIGANIAINKREAAHG